MKKLIALLLTGIMVLGMTACGGTEEGTSSTASKETVADASTTKKNNDPVTNPHTRAMAI